MIKAQMITIVIIVLSLIFVGCSVSDAVVEQAIAKTMAVKTVVPSQIVHTQTPFVQFTATLKPTATRKPTVISNLIPTSKSCVSPQTVTVNMKGRSVEVCGEVTEVGSVPCPTCYYGGYSYMILGDSLRIISYDWILNSEWKGSCVRVKDQVESLSNKPIFVLGAKEGYDGSECTIDVYGSQSCLMGYFQDCR